jgi:glycosyltransferase involved in cell wall biosynthesis
MELIQEEKDIILDVYSSTIIYGDEFHRDNESKFLKLYERARDLKNVNYKGYCRHDELVGKLKDYDASVHPSTFEETFCISAMEALAAGCLLITTNLGAIPETCGEFPIYIPYSANKKYLAAQTAETIKNAKTILSAGDPSHNLKFQQQYYKNYYDWKVIGAFWNRFLRGAIYARRKQKNL